MERCPDGAALDATDTMRRFAANLDPRTADEVRPSNRRGGERDLRDTGVLHALLGIDDMQSLNVHPKSGASWEGFLLETIIDCLRLEDEQVHFWAARTGAELDLLITRGRRRIEEVAVRIAHGWEKERSAAVQDVSKPERARLAGLPDWPGFDLLATDPDGKVRSIEVKGRTGRGAIQMEANEWKQACHLGERYQVTVTIRNPADPSRSRKMRSSA